MYSLSTSGPWKPPVCVFRDAVDRPVTPPAMVKAATAKPEVSKSAGNSGEEETVTMTRVKWDRVAAAMAYFVRRTPDGRAILHLFEQGLSPEAPHV